MKDNNNVLAEMSEYEKTVYLLERRLSRYKKVAERLKYSLAAALSVAFLFMVSTGAANFEKAILEDEIEVLVAEAQQMEIEYSDLEDAYQLLGELHEIEIAQVENRYMTILHMTTDWKELAATVQGESGGEGLIGMKHVVSTVINRVDTQHWGPTILDVISAPRQYCAYGMNFDTISPDVAQAIDEVLLYGTINDAIFYMNPDHSAPSSRGWMRTKPFLFKYKNHEFYGG